LDLRPRTLAVLVGATVAVAALVLGVVAVSRRSAGEGPATAPAAALAADPVDVGFATDMFDHHQQALQMALLATDQASTTPVRTLAIEMIAGQQVESGRFVQYLEERGLRTSDPSDANRQAMAWMGMPTPRARMAGLATPDQMVALTNATGVAFDRLFLELMLHHHEGGVHMAQFAAEHGTDANLRGVATRMLVMQRREVADMEQLQGGLG
jgi:uncharacterized protein (DUF305 family)